MTCIFCKPDGVVVGENELAYSIRDAFPVSPGHTLVISRRHATTIFDLSAEECQACFELVRSVTVELRAQLKPDGFNIGVNCCRASGQTVMHAHIHVIPRFAGDVANPRGGVRHVISDKGKY